MRGTTSNRGIAVENGWTPKSGLGGSPVGISPHALRTNGLRPLCATMMPPALNTPRLSSSRRETLPSARA
jgi:hypothetical protein